LLTRGTVRSWTVGVSRAGARPPSAPVVFAWPTPRRWRRRSETWRHLHTPTLRLRNDDNFAAMRARHENRYTYKYECGYQAAVPQSALNEVHLSARFSFSLDSCLLIRHRTNLQTDLQAIPYRRKPYSLVTQTRGRSTTIRFRVNRLARDLLVLHQPMLFRLQDGRAAGTLLLLCQRPRGNAADETRP